MMFYKETEFQDTSIGKIPSDWQIIAIQKVCDLIRGTEPGSKSYNTKGRGYRFIRVSDLSKQILEPVFTNENERRLIFCNREDVLLALDGVPGVVNRGFEGAISSGIRILKPKTSNIIKDFLFQILQHGIVERVIANHTTGTTIKHASRAIDFIKIPVPIFTEQEKIAHILSVIDDTIVKTDKVIARTERLKKGLMQHLLTKGIGHKEYKDTLVGKTPKTWQTVKLGEVLNDIKYGTSVKATSNGQGFPVLGIPNVLGGKIDKSSLRYVDLPESERRNLMLEDGDILLVRTNANPDYIGRCALFENKRGTWLYASYLIRIRPDKQKVLPAYLVKFLQSERARRQFLSIARTSAGNYNINSQGIRAVAVCMPSLPEQQKIAEILSTIDNKLELERNEKVRLERVKRGLMDLLLTGKVRVKGD